MTAFLAWAVLRSVVLSASAVAGAWLGLALVPYVRGLGL
jgi:hypothetical protein